MKATGQLTFKQEADGIISRKWSGGRRIAISGELIGMWTGERPHIGQTVRFGDDLLRLIGFDVSGVGAGYQDNYVAMREGLLARFVAWYWHWLSDHAYSLFNWECKWLRGRKPIEAERYPKWSLVGLLIRPLI